VSRSLSRRQAILLGLVILLVLVLSGGAIFLIGSRSWFGSDSFHVRAGFKAIHGVEVGTRVRVNGITGAGEVVGVEAPATPQGDIILRLRIDGRYRSMVRSDAVVQIVSDGVIGGKVVEITAGKDGAAPAAEDALLASRPTLQASELLDQAGTVLKDLHDGEGEVGKRVVAMLDNMSGAAENISNAARSFAQTSDAIRKMPVVRSYDQDAETLLVRPDCKRTRTSLAESDLFEPRTAILTPAGERLLDSHAANLKASLAPKGAELVVATFADPKGSSTPASARTLTQKQSQVVLEYLKDRHTVQRSGSWTWPWRDVTALGLGIDPYPGQEHDPTLPPGRVELLVFVPQK
jgi:phospholipid/cholesterol/gamma-HCH transport system substrate-binding protein